ncbi:hypothetical protein [Rhizobium sp. MHM7A]|uniref:hypothetical protein n=1 Tax=Rhizobium sp. MHM7A TaxID=2583233 RepID=UPI001105E322|nr:hypothetical protein [Rhizobium sp. MHM7A]TLX15761.1 hypothetical protein FFR93_00135 [Rhizobium sp. MHM7A]
MKIPKPDIEFEIEKQNRESNARVRALLEAEGRPDLVAELDQRIRDVNLGLTQARNVWHSISPAQRTLLTLMMQVGSKLIREEKTSFYDLVAGPKVERRVTRRPTVRSLISRDLLCCEGGAFDPEAVVVLTENARFVFEKGRVSGS